MAITLTSDYSKKLGLPGYSSHQFSVSIQTELTDLERVPGEVARLYQLLQQAVDREIQQTGFVPDGGYGFRDNGTPDTSVPHRLDGGGGPNGNGGLEQSPAPIWNCSAKQRQLIADLADELELNDDEVDARSERLFKKPAHRLDKLGASGLISDLLAEAGTRRQRNSRSNGSNGNGIRRGNHAGANGNGGGRR